MDQLETLGKQLELPVLAMRAEKEKEFRARFGFGQVRSGPGFITPTQLERATADAGLRVMVWYADEDWLKRARRAWASHRIGRATPRFPIFILRGTHGQGESG